VNKTKTFPLMNQFIIQWMSKDNRNKPKDSWKTEEGELVLGGSQKVSE
jgi:hypothetical protein